MRTTIALVAALALASSLVIPTSIGQPVYSDPPCPDPGSNCDFRLWTGLDAPVPGQSFECPDCRLRFTQTSDWCQPATGHGETESCGTGTPETKWDYYQKFACKTVTEPVMGLVCDDTSPVDPPIPSIVYQSTATRYKSPRPCPNDDCLSEM